MLTDQQRSLVEANMRLVSFCLNRFRSYGTPDIASSYEDLFQIGCLALAEAALRYDPERGKFSTYAIPTIESKLLRYYRSLTMQRRSANVRAARLDAPVFSDDSDSISLADQLPAADDTEDLPLSNSTCDWAWQTIDNRLSPYAKELLMQRLQGKSQTQISQAIGKSQAQLSRDLKVIRRTLTNVRASLANG